MMNHKVILVVQSEVMKMMLTEQEWCDKFDNAKSFKERVSIFEEYCRLKKYKIGRVKL